MQSHKHVMWALGGFVAGILVCGIWYLETRYRETAQYLTAQSGPAKAAQVHFKLLAIQRLRSPSAYQSAQGLWADWSSIYFAPNANTAMLPSPVSALVRDWGLPDGTLESTPASLSAAQLALSGLPLDAMEKRLQRDFQDALLHLKSSTPDALFKPNTVFYRYAVVTDRFRKPIF